jgi:hypothetical protein
MKESLRRAFLALLAISLAACSSLSVVADTRDSVAAAADVSAKRLAPGDNLRLRLASGERVDLRLVSVERDALVGTTPDQGAPVRVPTGQIVTIERMEFSTLRTVLLAAGLFVLVYLVVQSIDVGMGGRID